MDVKNRKKANTKKSSNRDWLKLFSLLFATYHLPVSSQNNSPTQSKAQTKPDEQTPPDDSPADKKNTNEEAPNTEKKPAEENTETEPTESTEEPVEAKEAEGESEPALTESEAADAGMPTWASILMIGAVAGAIGGGAAALSGDEASSAPIGGGSPAPSGPLILNGTAAADIFEIPNAQNQIQINNFEDNKDIIDLTELGVSFNDVAYFDNSIDSTVTVTGGHTIQLQGFGDSTLLTASDFRFSVGTAGSDTLHAGSSNADMTGHAGADTFMFLQTNNNVTITDFQLGIDSLDLSDFGLNPGDVTTTTNGIDSTVYILGVAEITLEGMSDPSTFLNDVIL